MQNRISKAAVTWRLLLSLLIVSVVIACEDTNTVGGDVIEPNNVRIDTIYIDDFEQINSNFFSAGIQTLPIGNFSDPLFGQTISTGLIKPALLVRSLAEIDDSSRFELILNFENSLIVGDTTSTTNFEIYKNSERWRRSTLLSDDDISIDNSLLLGSFSHTMEDSITIEIDDSFVDEYSTFYQDTTDSRDSLYNFNFFGISIVPDAASSKIIHPNLDRSRFLSIRGEDTVAIFFGNSGFTIDNLTAASINNSLYLDSNLESIYSFNFDSELSQLAEDINILDAQFILYEEVDGLSQSLAVNSVRPEISSLGLKFRSSDALNYQVQFRANDFLALRDTSNNSFRFDITNHVNEYVFGDPIQKDLILALSPNGRGINSTLIYDSTAVSNLRPKIVLTIAE